MRIQSSTAGIAIIIMKVRQRRLHSDRAEMARQLLKLLIFAQNVRSPKGIVSGRSAAVVMIRRFLLVTIFVKVEVVVLIVIAYGCGHGTVDVKARQGMPSRTKEILVQVSTKRQCKARCI